MKIDVIHAMIVVVDTFSKSENLIVVYTSFREQFIWNTCTTSATLLKKWGRNNTFYTYFIVKCLFILMLLLFRFDTQLNDDNLRQDCVAFLVCCVD